MAERSAFDVLLVDDDEVFAMLFNEAVAELPEFAAACSFHRVADGDDALDYIHARGAYAERARHRRPDLVLLDQRMPRMDGTEVLAELKGDESTRSIPVCLLSTSRQDKQVETAYAHGATFCITKPMTYEALVETLGKLLDFMTRVVELPGRRKRRPDPAPQ